MTPPLFQGEVPKSLWPFLHRHHRIGEVCTGSKVAGRQSLDLGIQGDFQGKGDGHVQDETSDVKT